MFDFYNDAPTFDRYARKTAELTEKYPFIRGEIIGKSAVGRAIYGFSIGGRKKRVLFAAAFHGGEWLTCMLLIRFLEDLAAAVNGDLGFCGNTAEQLRKSLLSQGVYFVPMVNPDGVSIALEGAQSAGAYSESARLLTENAPDGAVWQANARGVDINHNFNAGFYRLKRIERKSGIYAPALTRYGGQCPHSEPETRSMARLLEDNPFEAVYAFHSQGEEIFYEYGKNTPPRGEYIAKILAAISGYTLKENGGLYSHGGFKDFFIERYSRPGFTFEVGKGKNPLPLSDLSEIYKQIKETMFAAMVL